MYKKMSFDSGPKKQAKGPSHIDRRSQKQRNVHNKTHRQNNRKREDNWRDSNNYRRQYFDKNPGMLGILYFCSQCTRPMTRNSKRLQVDHIVPPSRFATRRETRTKVKNTSFMARQLNKVDWNLVSICDKCNRRKSDKMGLYTVKGVGAKTLEVAGRVAAVTTVAALGASVFLLRGAAVGTFRLCSSMRRRNRRNYRRHRRTFRRRFRR